MSVPREMAPLKKIHFLKVFWGEGKETLCAPMPLVLVGGQPSEVTQGKKD